MTAETVRRDLKLMEGHGLLRRTHGGAYPRRALRRRPAICANGLTRDRGLTVPDRMVAPGKAKAVDVSRHKIYLGIHTNFGMSSFCRSADVPDFESLITDAALSAFEAQGYTAVVPQVLRVQPTPRHEAG